MKRPATSDVAPKARRPFLRGLLMAGGFVALAALGALSTTLLKDDEPAVEVPAESLAAPPPTSNDVKVETRATDPVTPDRSATIETPPANAPVAGSPGVPSEPAEAVLAITSTPSGARIMVDGKEIGTTPLTYGTRAGSRHELRLLLAGYREDVRHVEVRGTKELVATIFEAVMPVQPAKPGRGQQAPSRAPKPLTVPARPTPDKRDLEPVLIDED